jgi:tetratricopeptide (TPR) repeat protein
MSETGKAVFLSYASQDSEAARRICEALRSAGVEVWFDQSEPLDPLGAHGLVGGDAWDQKIRRQIKGCALFVPIISANTQARLEGYFRREWRLAVERMHDMDDEVPFLLPVVIDETTDAAARVPERFRERQWVRIGSADSLGAFCGRVRKMLSGEVGARASPPAPNDPAGQRPALPGKPTRRWIAPSVFGVLAGVILLLWQPWRTAASKAAGTSATTTSSTAAWPRNENVRRAYGLFAATNSTAADFTLAETILKSELAARPGDAEALTVFAQMNVGFISRGFDGSEARYILARQSAEQAQRVAPDDPEALFALGRYLQFRNADQARAEGLLRRAVDLKPSNPNIHAALVNAMLRRDQAAGLAEAEKMAARFPRHSITQFRVAIHLVDAGRLEESEQALDRALALELTSNSVVMKAMNRLMVHGDVAGMGQWIDRVPPQFRSEDRVVTARFLHGLVAGRTETALAALNAQASDWAQDFLYTGPRSLQRGILLQLQGSPGSAHVEFEAARAAIASAREQARTDANLINLEAWTLWYLGRAEEARTAARPILERVVRPYRISADNQRWWWSPLAQLLVFGERERALELLREAAAVPVGRARLRTALAVDPRMAGFRDDAEIKALLAVTE